MRILRNASGQSTAEYAVVIAIILAAAVGMQTFIKRGLQARFKVATDKLTRVSNDTVTPNADISLNTTTQYEPYYATSDLTTNNTNEVAEEFNGSAAGFGLSRTGTIRSVSRSGTTTEQDDTALTADDANWAQQTP